MPEAEVSLRLAEYLTGVAGFGGHVEVAVDGASVRVHGEEVFDHFGLSSREWMALDRRGCQEPERLGCNIPSRRRHNASSFTIGRW